MHSSRIYNSEESSEHHSPEKLDSNEGASSSDRPRPGPFSPSPKKSKPTSKKSVPEPEPEITPRKPSTNTGASSSDRSRHGPFLPSPKKSWLTSKKSVPEPEPEITPRKPSTNTGASSSVRPRPGPFSPSPKKSRPTSKKSVPEPEPEITPRKPSTNTGASSSGRPRPGPFSPSPKKSRPTSKKSVPEPEITPRKPSTNTGASSSDRPRRGPFSPSPKKSRPTSKKSVPEPEPEITPRKPSTNTGASSSVRPRPGPFSPSPKKSRPTSKINLPDPEPEIIPRKLSTNTGASSSIRPRHGPFSASPKKSRPTSKIYLPEPEPEIIPRMPSTNTGFTPMIIGRGRALESRRIAASFYADSYRPVGISGDLPAVPGQCRVSECWREHLSSAPIAYQVSKVLGDRFSDELLRFRENATISARSTPNTSSSDLDYDMCKAPTRTKGNYDSFNSIRYHHLEVTPQKSDAASVADCSSDSLDNFDSNEKKPRGAYQKVRKDQSISKVFSPTKFMSEETKKTTDVVASSSVEYITDNLNYMDLQEKDREDKDTGIVSGAYQNSQVMQSASKVGCSTRFMSGIEEEKTAAAAPIFASNVQKATFPSQKIKKKHKLKFKKLDILGSPETAKSSKDTVNWLPLDAHGEDECCDIYSKDEFPDLF